MIVSSLKLTKGLNKIGVFYQNKEKINKEKEELVFFFHERKINCLHINDYKTTNNIEVIVINYATDFNKRNKGIIDESVLQKRKVTIFGLGSGGSAIAIYLVRCGVTNLNLIEFDIVGISNLCRSVYDLPDVGKKKADSLLEKLLRINPNLNIKLYDEDILEMDSEKLDEIIDNSDLIIEATDSAKTKRLINGLAYHTTPVIYPAVYENGKGGDILFTLPGFPCWECIFSSLYEEMKKNEREWDYTIGQPKPMPGLISDIQIIVSRTVKLALAILTGDQKESFFEKITEPACTLLLISNEKKGVNGFNMPFQEAWVETKINPECSCQTLM